MDIRDEFEIWLKQGFSKKCSSTVCIGNLMEVSDYALSKKITKVDFFEIINYRQFNDIRRKILDNKLFRITHRKVYRIFEKTSKLFADFLKQFKFEDAKNLPVKQVENERTIVDAIIEVLKIRAQLTSLEIYNEIIAKGLYNFGAKVPQSVVFTELMRHCENQTTYSITSKNKLFKIVGEHEKQKMFSLIKNDCSANECRESKAEKHEIKPLIEELTWNDEIAKAFHAWLLEQNKADATARQYVSCIRSLVTQYPSEFAMAKLESNAQLGIIRFIDLLRKNKLFNSNEAAPAQHNRFTAALSSFSKYLEDVLQNFHKVCSMGLTKQEVNILSLFKNSFPRGIRIRFTDFMNLKAAYEKCYGESCPFSDNELTEIIKSNGIETESHKYVHIDHLLCNISLDDIEKFIAEQNELGAQRIWLNPLYDYFRDRLGDAVNAELLAKILQERGKKKYHKDNYYGFITYSGLSLHGQREEMRQAVVNLLSKERNCMTLKEIQLKFPAYPPLTTKKGLNLADNPYIIELPDGTFGHIDCIYITEDEIAVIDSLIENEIAETRQVKRESFQEKLEERLSSIFENNEAFGKTGVWKAIGVRLSEKYDFSPETIEKRR